MVLQIFFSPNNVGTLGSQVVLLLRVLMSLLQWDFANVRETGRPANIEPIQVAEEIEVFMRWRGRGLIPESCVRIHITPRHAVEYVVGIVQAVWNNRALPVARKNVIVGHQALALGHVVSVVKVRKIEIK